MNKPILYMLVGLPASGKSSWAEKHRGFYRYPNKDYTWWVSSDHVRWSNHLKDNNKVFNIVHKKVFEALKRGDNAIYDATNISRKCRIAFLKDLEQKKIDCKKVCLLFLTPVYLCKERNAEREGNARVPEEVIDRMLRQFQLPMMSEGWDEIRIETSQIDTVFELSAWVKEFGFSKMEIFSGKVDMDQENEHHNLTLVEHQKHTMMWAATLGKPVLDYDVAEVLLKAARYHDIGKFWTKTKTEGDANAHYYAHENVGAYEFLILLLMSKSDDIFKVKKDVINKGEYMAALLINWHMRPYEWEKHPHIIEKDKKLFNNRFYMLLQILHGADKEAH